MNSLRSGHFLKQCKSLHHCRKCQKPHHILLHIEPEVAVTNTHASVPARSRSHTVSSLKHNSLLMSCRVIIVNSSNGVSKEARALLGSASSTSFISECLAKNLHLQTTRCATHITGITGLMSESSVQSVTKFTVSPVMYPVKHIEVNAIVVPKVTCELPVCSVPFNPTWNHLKGIDLADPDFGCPGQIDVLLGVDVFINVLQQGRRIGSPSAPVALQTDIGSVLAGNTNCSTPCNLSITCHYSMVLSSDELIRKFGKSKNVQQTI